MAVNREPPAGEKEVLAVQLHGLASSDAEDPGRAGLLEYASFTDKGVLLVSAVCAVISGALNPLLTVR